MPSHSSINQYRVYCSGSIQKGISDFKKMCWTDEERSALRLGAQPLDIEFLNPDDAVHSMNDNFALFGRDMFQISVCNAVVIDGRERRGIGIGVELLAGRYFNKFVVAVLPPNSYYRQQALEYRGGIAHNYIHPHFFALADTYVDDFYSAGLWLKDNRRSSPTKVAATILDEAIDSYRTHLYPHDAPMRALLGD